MKKILALILAVLMVCVSMVACTVEKAPEADADVEVEANAEAEVEAEAEAEVEENEPEEEAVPEADADDFGYTAQELVDLLNAQGIETGVEGMIAAFELRDNNLVFVFTLNEELATVINDDVLAQLVEMFAPTAEALVTEAPIFDGIVMDFYTEAGELIGSTSF